MSAASALFGQHRRRSHRKVVLEEVTCRAKDQLGSLNRLPQQVLVDLREVFRLIVALPIIKVHDDENQPATVGSGRGSRACGPRGERRSPSSHRRPSSPGTAAASDCSGRGRAADAPVDRPYRPTCALIRTMSQTNPIGVAPRIHGNCSH